MILLIDSYDSFSHNLSRLVENSTGKEVVTIYNDTFSPSEYASAFESWIQYFDYIVVGPGPGHPDIASDIGIVKWLYQHFLTSGERVVPILGVCLGFQSLCNETGNKVTRLDAIKHGQVYEMKPVASDLFGYSESDLASFASVRYHSLHVEISTLNGQIVPLATCDDSEHSTPLLMAGKHTSLPLYGVQYHPESICSDKGETLVRRFDSIAKAYNDANRSDLPRLQDTCKMKEINDKYTRDRAVHEKWLVPDGKLVDNELPHFVFQRVALADSSTRPLDVCDHLEQEGTKFILLNSAADPGEWSIIGLPIDGVSEVITHSIDSPQTVNVLKFNSEQSEDIRVASVWEFVSQRMQMTYVSRETIEAKMTEKPTRPLPFFGGYMGLFSYEEGHYVNTKEISSFCDGPTPDTKLVHIERALVHDRISNQWYFLSIRNENDESEWCQKFLAKLLAAQDLVLKADSVPTSVKLLCKPADQKIQYSFPDRNIYREQFETCQENLHSGDSYELCLTTQLKLYLPRYLNTWDIYKVLAVHKNPSPYSCYMNFDDCVLISSSPERFVSWKDSQEQPGRKIVELRPIKGTVRNTEDVTLEDATKLLRTPKEMGENLMIVDLIRHDLNSFIDDVRVNGLMKVEEYKTVYQLVSVIQGHLKSVGYKGIDVLHLSLPPGSMTGAPKKRSVELLQHIESMQPTMISGGRRGIYSGVAGYWSISDDADWSVVIRSIMHYKNDKENNASTNVWRIGAGGAITVLSEEEGEWEEMQVKLSSTLQTFT
ncbi:CIC11C00000003861 [Sungouiella intermedia]|uniref:aminodeoxychorismate synthase n=1 Tax=Sungouiella intermedia TaxID=45354 RepID=A0A1L0GAN2_9ASCO|nr:CIC11C00000003861 [[Candida] intermedia]